MSLGKVSIAIEAQMASFESDMGRAARVAEKNLRKIEADARKTEAQMKAIGKAMGLAIVAGATAATVALKGAINAMDDMSKAAQRANMPTEDFSRLAYAGKLADVSMEDLTGSLGKLAKAQGDAMRATSVQARVFEGLGIAIKNTDGTMRSTSDVFKDFADVFQQMKGSPEIMAAGMNIFGRSFQKLIPLMKDGSEGLAAAGVEADKLGITLSTKAGQQAEEFNDNLTRLQTAAQGLVQTVAIQLLPELIAISEKFLDAANDGDVTREAVDTLKASFDGIVSIGGSVVSTGLSIQSALGGIKGEADSSAESLRQLIQSARGLAAIPASMAAYFDATVTGSDAAVGRFNAANAEMSAGWTGKPIPGVTTGPKADFSRVSGVGASTATDRESASRAAAIRAGLADPVKAAKKGSSKKSDAEREAESLQRAYDSIMDSQKERIALFGQETEVSKVTYDTQFGALSKLTEAQKAAAIAGAAELDLLKKRADAEKKLADEKEKAAEAAKRQAETVKDFIADQEFELKLLGMSNIQRQREIALRYANVDAASVEGKKIVENVNAINAAAENAAFIEDFKTGLADAFVDFASGAKSAKEAFGDFADALYKRALQFLADKAIQAMFDAFSGNSTGAASGGAAAGGGGGWAGIATAVMGMFGGPRAAGGPVSGSKFYEVGENDRPEILRSRGKSYLIPGNDGNVTPIRSGGNRSLSQTFVVQGTPDRRTAEQMSRHAGREAARGMARTGR